MALGLAMAAGLVMAGCSMNGFGGATPVVETPVAAPPPPIVYGAFLEGPIGSRLDTSDRDKALAAEQDALASGQRRTWKGNHGTFGYVEPAAAPAPAAEAVPGTEACKGFTATVYIGGRPQVGHGTGCLNPDGSYRITS